jgi:hypothetical protein
VSQQINLFNPIFLKKEKYFSALTMLQALGLIALGTALMGGYASFELSRLRPEANAVTAQLGAAQGQLAGVKAQVARQKDNALEAELQRVEAEVLALQRISRSLNQNDARNNIDGYSEYMRAFSRQIMDGIWLTGFSIGGSGSEISISGGALRPELVPAFLNRLSTEPTMHGKAFGTLEMSRPESEGAGSKASFVVFRLRSSESLAQETGRGVTIR